MATRNANARLDFMTLDHAHLETVGLRIVDAMLLFLLDRCEG